MTATTILTVTTTYHHLSPPITTTTTTTTTFTWQWRTRSPGVSNCILICDAAWEWFEQWQDSKQVNLANSLGED